MQKNQYYCRASSRTVNYFLLSLFILSVSFKAGAITTQQLQKVGQGTMSWMFLNIYDAALLTPDGNYQKGTYPQALTITYLKNINKNRLIKATKEQWQLQRFSDENINEWLHSIDEIWPDIKDGDRLTFYVGEDKKGYFYHNDTLLGGIENQAFSGAFLAIWLSEQTSQPQLRRQLLGL